MQVVKIGRASGNDVIINDPKVSRIHCQIIKEDNGTYRAIDLNSLNGTYVNGIKRSGEIMLNESDIIRIGNSTLPWLNYFSKDAPAGFPNTPERPQPPLQPQPYQKPKSFLVWSILATVLCCLPFGIASIVYESKVDGLWASGQYEQALEAAKKARNWFWWAFGLGLAWAIFVFIYYVILGMSFAYI